jgi:(+)-pinoresinol hydroxylase
MKRLLLIFAVIASATPHVHGQAPAAALPAWSRTVAAPQDRGSPAERGAAVYNNWCSACHSKDLRNAPGTVSLQFKYQGRLPAALEDRRDLTPESIKRFVRQGVAMMPFFRKTEVGDADLEALAAYLAPSAPRR